MTSLIASKGVVRSVRGVGGKIMQILQVASDYPGVPDVRTLKLHEITFFYEPLIPGLLKTQNKT